MQLGGRPPKGKSSGTKAEKKRPGLTKPVRQELLGENLRKTIVKELNAPKRDLPMSKKRKGRKTRSLERHRVRGETPGRTKCGRQVKNVRNNRSAALRAAASQGDGEDNGAGGWRDGRQQDEGDDSSRRR